MAIITWDAINKGSSAVLSNGNLTATGLNSTNYVRASVGNTKGKWYWEIKVDLVSSTMIGIANSLASMNASLHNTANVRLYYFDGRKYTGATAYGASYTTGDVIGIALDLDVGTLGFYKNGVSQGIAFNDIKTMGEVFPSVGSGSSAGQTGVTARFSKKDFQYPVPSGFRAYESELNKTLISLSNGEVKYLGGGSPAIIGANIVPTMTSDTSPTGVASASSFNTSYNPYLAFNKDFASTGWRGKDTTNQWLSYQFDQPRVIIKYSLTTTVASRTPKDWTFEGSNDNFATFTVLDTQTNQTGWITGVSGRREFTINPNKVGSYKSYRLFSIINNGDANFTDIAELELIGVDAPATPSSWKTITTSTPTKSEFETYGMDDLSVVAPEQWSDLLALDSDVKLLTYVPTFNVSTNVNVSREGKGISMTALPKGQLVINQKYIKTYGSISQAIVKELNTGKSRGVIKVVMSFADNVWYYYSAKDSSFKIVNLTESNVKQFGNTLEEISAISQASFNSVNSRSQVKFSYYIEEDIREKTSAMVDYTELKQEAVFSSPEISNMSLYILNTISTINMNLVGRELTGTISDVDSTKVRYKVFLNGVQYYPRQGYTEFAPSPLFLSLNLDGQYINMGVQNIVSVEFQDYWGATETWSLPFIGEYYGLIFEDPLSNAYATDIGQVLKYLDIGTLIAGQKSTEYEIKLHNTNGYSVENPTITSYSEQSGVSFELSKTQSPFVGEEKITFNQVLLDGESVRFFLRVATKLDTPPKMGGMFELRVNADKI